MALENPPRLLFFEAVFIEDNEGRATQRHGQIGQILHEILLSHSCNPVNRLWLMCMYMFRFGIIRMMVPSLLKWKQLCDCVVFPCHSCNRHIMIAVNRHWRGFHVGRCWKTFGISTSRMVLFQGALPIDERSSTLFAAVLACHHMLWLVNIKMHDAPPVFSPESPEKETTTSVP